MELGTTIFTRIGRKFEEEPPLRRLGMKSALPHAQKCNFFEFTEKGRMVENMRENSAAARGSREQVELPPTRHPVRRAKNLRGHGIVQPSVMGCFTYRDA